MKRSYVLEGTQQERTGIIYGQFIGWGMEDYEQALGERGQYNHGAYGSAAGGDGLG